MASYNEADIRINSKLLENFLLENFPDHFLMEQFASTWRQNETVTSLYNFSKEELILLNEYLEKNDEKSQLIQKITKYINILDSFSTKVPKLLEDLSLTLREYFRKKSYNYLLIGMPNRNSYCERLYRIKSIDYVKYDRQNQQPASVSVTLQYVVRNKKQSVSFTYCSEDIKKGTIEELLYNKGLRIATEEDYKNYKSHLAYYQQLSSEVGFQYTTSEKVFSSSSDADEVEFQRYNVSHRNILPNGEVSKFVIDETSDYEVINFYENDKFFMNQNEEEKSYACIDHCIIKLFSLDKHLQCFSYVELLKKYEYNPEIYKKLILPESHKECMNTILEFNPKDFSDVVANKSGGIIVLASGPAGVGKTLSAETYSELIQKPLYSVQSAQLGISIQNIEKNLERVLNRASKWKAVLLIDEADVFIRARNNDLQQNAIVGVFLRILEHFDGVLFMTTNRFLDNDGSQFVDDAILSRCIAHLHYYMPTKEAIEKIFEIQCDTLEVKHKKEDVSYILANLSDYNISGRDIKNIVKLSKMFMKREEKEFIDWDVVKRILPFHSTISKKVESITNQPTN